MAATEKDKLRKGERTRLRLKKTALRLFAQRGIENVSIRDIQAAAGQKNNGSITYYFSSRDALIREIVADVAAILDEDNNRRLDALEARGGPTSVREVAEILLPVVDRGPDGDKDDLYQLQFFTSVLITRRDLLFEATADADRATRRCFRHIVRLAPDMPKEIINQRLQMMLLFALSAGASMESGQEGHRNWSSLWGQASAEHNLADIMAGMIIAPVSDKTLAAVGQKKEPAVDEAGTSAPA
ncbi:TetR/AcrR family transcriptional regulator [Pseudooceanicola nitratireducens]|uniref:TetR/AcrR family transcriptional regulator n=1 Tax=Pseudooceanicola nitratireducens TaxID=517719 RepID=UPI001C98C625|nr:TetR/AcrR family transcriptional regulator [Pseudooceanicola nitratireducens]MBY6159119.1 TetR/AcrR family transcriptional regulator [Pseudooceanicola nitratireducens]